MPDYVPLDDFTELDDNQSSEPIHNYPADKAEYKLSVYPPELTFAETRIGKMSSTVALVLINSGYAPLTIENVEVVGDFMMVGTFPASLVPDEVAGILVRFKPKTSGVISGGVYIDTGNAAGREFVRLVGTGTPSMASDLGTDIIRLYNNGNGTANAIQASSEEVIPTATGAKLFALNIVLNNSGAATLQINGNTPLTILEQDGTALESADLVADTMVLGYI